MTLNPGGSNDVIVQSGGNITVNANAAGVGGDLIVTGAKNFTMASGSSVTVDGVMCIGYCAANVFGAGSLAMGTAPLTGTIILNNLTLDANHNATPGSLGLMVGGATSGGVATTTGVQLNGTITATAWA